MRSWYLLEESVYKTLDASLGIQRHKGSFGATVRGAKSRGCVLAVAWGGGE